MNTWSKLNTKVWNINVCTMHPDVLPLDKKVTSLSYVQLNSNLFMFEKNVDTDQLASWEASWSGSTLFSRRYWQENRQKWSINLVKRINTEPRYLYLCWNSSSLMQIWSLVLFDLILYIPSTIFQLNRDGPSLVESVLSWDKCILLNDHNGT